MARLFLLDPVPIDVVRLTRIMYRLFFRLSVVVFALVLSASVIPLAGAADSLPTYPPQTVVPDNWKKIDLGDFSFYAPSDMKRKKEHGIDSEVWTFRNGKLTLMLDYGMYSGGLDGYHDRTDYHAEWISIDGRRAQIGTLLMPVSKGPDKNRKYVAAVYFPDLGSNGGKDVTKLSIWADCVDSDAQESAKKIFLSIKFK